MQRDKRTKRNHPSDEDIRRVLSSYGTLGIAAGFNTSADIVISRAQNYFKEGKDTEANVLRDIYHVLRQEGKKVIDERANKIKGDKP